jgi:glyoxylase-like metal-dependent hydrolase (beta-lactamase superfamily II)/ferredoxin
MKSEVYIEMADQGRRLAENVPGDFFVDSTCIDCDACRQIAPSCFRDHGDQSSVYHQPDSEREVHLALMALVACPTASIGTGQKHDAKAAVDAFPMNVSENVYFCGFNSESSFGAWSYLIVRPSSKGGNVLVDSPRFNAPLVRKIESMGGVAQMFLTHRDDVADHAKFAARFNCPRIMHAADGAGRLQIETVIAGEEKLQLGEDLTIIPTPGHTRGHMVLLYKNKFLFTGDHLAWSPDKNTLTAFRSVAWYSWKEQIRSMEKLLAYQFEWVLPGHGRIHHEGTESMNSHLKRCLDWMQKVA